MALANPRTTVAKYAHIQRINQNKNTDNIDVWIVIIISPS